MTPTEVENRNHRAEMDNLRLPNSTGGDDDSVTRAGEPFCDTGKL
jgi:hypothetical protein